MKLLTLQLGHNATAGLAIDGEVVGVLSQEKLDNVKNSYAFPIHAIKALCQEHNIDTSDITKVIVAGEYVHNKFLSDRAVYPQAKIASSNFFRSITKSNLVTRIRAYFMQLNRKQDMKKFGENLSLRLKSEGINCQEVIHVDHHTCHAFSGKGYFSDLPNEYLTFTLDGEGDAISGSVWHTKQGITVNKVTLPVQDSLGYVYSGVTKYLGMKVLEHEYKVMGLSAYCKDRYVDEAFDLLFKDSYEFVETANGWVFSFNFDTTRTAERLVALGTGIRFDNVAGAVQRLTEEVVSEWVKLNCDFFDCHETVFSGGVFMNVKLNKKLQEIPSLHSTKFLPSCGDESNVIGAAYKFMEDQKIATKPMNNMYGGISISSKELELLPEIYKKKGGVIVEKHMEINSKVAELLFAGEVVGRASGRNEWGARSLGNRAILGNPSKLETFYMINDQIKSRDFWMPFAPSILDRRATDYLIDFQNINSYPFAMITAYEATEKGFKDLRAGVHQGDHTCRPQIVTKQLNPSYYDLLEKFEVLSGVGGLLNTSLNIHGYPLVARLDEVLFTFENSGLKYIAINDYLLTKV